MAEAQDRNIVLKIYEDFSQGNITAILKHFDDDIELMLHAPEGTPFKKTFHGRDGAADFLKTIAEHLDVQDFSTEDIIAQGDKVVVLGHERVRVKTTEKIYNAHWAHVWTVRSGKIVKLVEYTDTAVIAEAFRP